MHAGSPAGGCLESDRMTPDDAVTLTKFREISDALNDTPFLREVTFAAFRVAKQTEADKNSAYAERNKLVAALSKLFPASLELAVSGVNEPIDPEWKWVVIIDLPTGQVSWHIKTSEFPMFGHLLCGTGRKWDGHTTEQKYERLSNLQVQRV